VRPQRFKPQLVSVVVHFVKALGTELAMVGIPSFGLYFVS